MTPSFAQLTAKDIMCQKVITISENGFISDVVTTLYTSIITGAPVVNERDELVGVISLNDVARFTAGIKGIKKMGVEEEQNTVHDYHRLNRNLELDYDLEEGFSIEEGNTTTAKDIMSKNVVTVEESCSIRKISRMMIDQHIHRVIVVKENKIVGIVSTLDILNIIADAKEEP